ncbi:hypothetical protein HZ994_07625 [Akkermansiaceae bacterium]|nr:hypothetical protein HZ994_07625 [Akkermansiaceae bacterium]
MPPAANPEFPLQIIVLAYIATAILIIILLQLLRMNGRLAALSARLSRSSRSEKLAEPDAEPGIVEVGPGTPFETFLKEDPERRTLAKKEQFKAYRKWRAEKGLNWSAKD